VRVTNYFKAVVYLPGVARFSSVETFGFDGDDDDDTRRAWAACVHFKHAQAFARMVLISLWQPIERRGPWSYGVALVGKSRGWLDDDARDADL
jgi:hypothetical protein